MILYARILFTGRKRSHSSLNEVEVRDGLAPSDSSVMASPPSFSELWLKITLIGKNSSDGSERWNVFGAQNITLIHFIIYEDVVENFATQS